MTTPLDLLAPGRRQSLYIILRFKQRPVFLLNSRMRLFIESPDKSGEPFIPKLQGNFAEFLSGKSLARLRLFTLPTCVGLRYGHPGDS